MDEHKLAAMFRDAVRDAPPASFDERDVVVASRRAAVKQRNQILVGSTLGVLVLLGGGTIGYSMLDGGRPESQNGSTASVAEPRAGNDSPGEKRDSSQEPPTGFNLDNKVVPSKGGPPPASIFEVPSWQGGGTSGSADHPVGSTQAGCGSVDSELAVALADELRVAAGTPPWPATGKCPVGAKAAGYVLQDGDVAGTVIVVLSPQDNATGFRDPGTPYTGDDGTLGYFMTARSGKLLVVFSRPLPGSFTAPFASQVESVAKNLALRF